MEGPENQPVQPIPQALLGSQELKDRLMRAANAVKCNSPDAVLNAALTLFEAITDSEAKRAQLNVHYADDRRIILTREDVLYFCKKETAEGCLILPKVPKE